MQFGVTFYPDQHPKEIWDREFSKIKETGFEIVRFAEMSWDLLEPTDGNFDFNWLDEALSLCEKHGLKVLLGVPVAQAPQWLVRKHPEILHVANDGFIHPAYGPRPNACRDNETYKQYALRLTEKMAERYAQNPAVYMWQIDNEPNYPPLDLTHNKDYCHCEASNKAFVEWAKEKYKTVENLNKAWGANFWSNSFSDFSEISSPRCGMWDAGNPHIYLDWQRFKSDSLSKWLNILKETIRKYDKTRKIGTNGFTSIVNRIADNYILARNMDWFGWDIYPKGTDNSDESLAQIADYWRSICESNGAEFVVSELQGGPNIRWGSGKWVKGDEIKRWVKILSDHGAKIILFHNWLPPLYGSETAGFGIMKPDSTPTERYYTIRELISVFKAPATKRRGSLNTGNREVHSQVSSVTIFYSRSSDMETFQEEGPSRPVPSHWFSGRADLGLFYTNDAIAGAYRLCYEKGITPDFIFEHDLEKRLGNYKILFLTNPYILSQKNFETIRRFIENGGTVVSDSRFGQKDENAKLNPNPLIENLIGVTHIYTEALNQPMPLQKAKARATGFRDILEIKNKKIEVLYKFKDGYPALLKAKIGKGSIIYAAFSIFQSILKFGNKSLGQFL